MERTRHIVSRTYSRGPCAHACAEPAWITIAHYNDGTFVVEAVSHMAPQGGPKE